MEFSKAKIGSLCFILSVVGSKLLEVVKQRTTMI